MSFISHLNKKVEELASHAWSKTILFFIAVLEITISPILPEAFIAAILAFRKDLSWKTLAFVSAIGSTVGAFIMYFIGAFFYKSIGSKLVAFYDAEKMITVAAQYFEQNTFIAMFVASFTPLPDRVFALASGIFSAPLFLVLLGMFLGRLMRASIVAYLAHRYGEKARYYIVKHTTQASLIFFALIALCGLLKLGGIL